MKNVNIVENSFSLRKGKAVEDDDKLLFSSDVGSNSNPPNNETSSCTWMKMPSFLQNIAQTLFYVI